MENDVKNYKKLLKGNLFFFSLEQKVKIANLLTNADKEQLDKLIALDIKNPFSYILISIVFGLLGVDRFMRKKIVSGIFKLLITIVFFFLDFSFIPKLWWIADAIFLNYKTIKRNKKLILDAFNIEPMQTEKEKSTDSDATSENDVNEEKDSLDKKSEKRTRNIALACSIFGFMILLSTLLPWAVVSKSIRCIDSSVEISLNTMEACLCDSFNIAVNKASEDTASFVVAEVVTYFYNEAEPFIKLLDTVQEVIVNVQNYLKPLGVPIRILFHIDIKPFLKPISPINLENYISSQLKQGIYNKTENIRDGFEEIVGAVFYNIQNIIDSIFEPVYALGYKFYRNLIILSVITLILFVASILFSVLRFFKDKEKFKKSLIKFSILNLCAIAFLVIRFTTYWPEQMVMNKIGVAKLANSIEDEACNVGEEIESWALQFNINDYIK